MLRVRRFAVGVAAAIAVSIGAPRLATAEEACDGGTQCSDNDGDGFLACGCPWAGTPCDCDDNDPASFPRAPEACDTPKDNNCSGVVADSCPNKQGCFGSVCVPECVPLSDFGCAIGSTLTSPPDGGRCLCAPKDCTIFGCPSGSTCDDAKTCVANCNSSVRCPYGQRCRGFGCVDPCAEVTCPDGGVCNGGLCVPSCTCCPAGQTCDVAAPVPTCIESTCAGVVCPGGSHCEHGACVDDCAGVVCPPMRVCRIVSVNGKPGRGACVDLCARTPCKPGFACDWRTGGCTPLPTAEGGITSPDSLDDALEVGGAGWLCSSSALSSASGVTGLAGLSALVLFVVRRRRRNGGKKPDRSQDGARAETSRDADRRRARHEQRKSRLHRTCPPI